MPTLWGVAGTIQSVSILRPPPVATAAAWIPMASDAGVVVDWLAENSGNDTWPRRVTVVPQKRVVDMADDAVQHFAANGNLHSGRGTPGSAGGPVLAYRPDLELLGDAVALADGQALGVIEFFPGEVAGWAAATNAINLETGEPTPGVPEEILTALEDLKQAGYNGYFRDREAFFAAKYFPPIDELRAAGYDYKFVAGYLIALGVDGKSVGGDLERIYVPKEKRRKVSNSFR